MTDPSSNLRSAQPRELKALVSETTSTLPLTQSHQLLVRTDTEQSSVEIATREGKQVVQIELSAQGIQLRAGALTLTWDEQCGLRLQVDKLTLVGTEQVSIETQGDLSLRAGGRLTLTGTDQVIAATVGDVEIRANDNVALNGEKILLNC